MGLFGSLLKTAIDVVSIPVSVVVDVATLGGELTDHEPYTQQHLRAITKDVVDVGVETIKIVKKI